MAMRDAWLAGVGLRENMTVQPTAGNPGTGLLGATLLGPMIGMLGAMADLAAANRQRFDQSSAEGAIGLPPGGQLAQAVGANAADGRASGAERLLAADELRALLREVGDLAVREARILQSELSNLDESLAQNLQQPDLSGSYRRRWRSKI